MIKFGELVRIKSGFYEGCEGRVTGYHLRDNVYYIDIKKTVGSVLLEKTITVGKCMVASQLVTFQ